MWREFQKATKIWRDFRDFLTKLELSSLKNVESIQNNLEHSWKGHVDCPFWTQLWRYTSEKTWTLIKELKNLYRIVKKTREKAARKSGSLGCLNCWHKKGQPWQGSKKFLVLVSLPLFLRSELPTVFLQGFLCPGNDCKKGLSRF